MNKPMHFTAITKERYLELEGLAAYLIEDLTIYCSRCGCTIITDLLWVDGPHPYCSKCRRDQ